MIFQIPNRIWELHRLVAVKQRATTRSVGWILAKRGAPVPAVIKLDVEGAGRPVLASRRKFFGGPLARLLIDTHGLEMFRECLKFLFETGHTVAACMPESWNAGRHMILTKESIAGYKTSMTCTLFVR